MTKKQLKITILIVLALAAGTIFVLNSNSTNSDTVAEQKVESGFQGSIDPQEFSTLIDSGEYVVLDIRTNGEYDAGRITEDLLLIDFYKASFQSEIDKLDKEQKYLIYCNSGNRSGSAAAMMEDAGFTYFYELDGGITAWSVAGLDVVK